MVGYSVFVTRDIPEDGLDLLRAEGCEVTVRSSLEIPTSDDLIEGIRGNEALLCLLTDQVDSEVIGAGQNLKVIANYAVGFNNIDVSAATNRGIIVTNTPGVLTDTTAEMAWALMMAAARRIVEADRYSRAGSFKRWESNLLLGSDVHGKTLGVIGLGRIGMAFAKRSLGFDMRLLYHNRKRVESEVEEELGAEYVDLETLLRESDFVSIHTPLTHETRHMIGPRELQLMKDTAYLVNTSRGPVIDEEALADALESGIIAGAGLDVYEREPEINPRLLELDNVVLAPHIGSGSVETRTKMSVMAAENIIAAMRGERPPNIVNPEVLEKG
jgi:glyoxylate reductase